MNADRRGFNWPSGYLKVKKANGDSFTVQGISWDRANEYMEKQTSGAVGEYFPCMYEIHTNVPFLKES